MKALVRLEFKEQTYIDRVLVKVINFNFIQKYSIKIICFIFEIKNSYAYLNSPFNL